MIFVNNELFLNVTVHIYMKLISFVDMVDKHPDDKVKHIYVHNLDLVLSGIVHRTNAALTTVDFGDLFLFYKNMYKHVESIVFLCCVKSELYRKWRNINESVFTSLIP